MASNRHSASRAASWVAELPDPAGLMQGAGKVHRHVQLRTAADLERPELNRLLAAALVAWRQRAAAMPEKAKRKS